MNTKKTAETNDKELYNVSKWKCRIKQLLIYIYKTRICNLLILPLFIF